MPGGDNVLVKLSDYGISQFVATQGARGLVGTPGFMAPEMLKYQGKEVQILHPHSICFKVWCNVVHTFFEVIHTVILDTSQLDI